jgi:hypothetical protein
MRPLLYLLTSSFPYSCNLSCLFILPTAAYPGCLELTYYFHISVAIQTAFICLYLSYRVYSSNSASRFLFLTPFEVVSFFCSFGLLLSLHLLSPSLLSETRLILFAVLPPCSLRCSCSVPVHCSPSWPLCSCSCCNRSLP